MFSIKKAKIDVPSPMPKIRKALDRSTKDYTVIFGLAGLRRHLLMGWLFLCIFSKMPYSQKRCNLNER